MNKVFMSKRNGELVVGKPIGIIQEEITLDFEDGDWKIYATTCNPIGYALFHEDECLALCCHEQISVLPLEDLGEL